nr:cell cycle checkpoint protein RAD17 [Crypthecodinium cohnii]
MPLPPSLWSERFTPQSEEELVVSKKKVAEVKEFLCGRLSSANTLILRGPPGSGKAAVLKALAADLGVQVAEWRPMARSELVDGVSLPESFLTFLTQADRYSRLQTVGDSLMSAVNRPCLALVRDFPFTFLDNSWSGNNSENGLTRSEKFVQHFQELLQRGELRRAVFCFNNSTDDYRTIKRLFLQSGSSASITTIEFPPVAKTFVQRVLDNILKSQGLKAAALGIDTSALATECSGDLRQAITGLQLAAGSISASAAFAAVAGRPGAAGRGGRGGARGRAKAAALTAAAKSASSPPTPSASTTSSVAVRNVSLDMFHALGKLLWCKRVPPPSYLALNGGGGGKPPAKRARRDANGSTVDPVQLPHEMLVPKSDRPPLYFVPETILNSTNKEPNVLVDWMFTNAPRFCGDVDDLAEYAKHLAEVDSWTPFPWGSGRGGSAGDAGSSVLEELASGVQTRALLDANLHPTKPMFDDPCAARTEEKQDVASQAVLFNLCRPLMVEVWRLSQRRLSDLASELETLDSLSLGGVRAGASTHARSMMLHTLPLAHLMLLGSAGNHITLRRLPHKLMSLMFELNDPIEHGLRGPESTFATSDGDASQAAMEAWNTALDDDPIED